MEHLVWIKCNIWDPATCNFKDTKYLGSIIGDSAIPCDETIEARETAKTKTILQKIFQQKLFQQKKFQNISTKWVKWKMENF